jgi:DNA-binding protein HU-beta
MEAMNEGETITIRNFGTFYVQEKPERKRRNPQNGKPIIVSAEKVVKFRSTQPLKS